MSPDRRKHRGADSRDLRLFSPENVPTLRTAAAELSWLLGKGYSVDSSLALVGDRHQLTKRQRIAVRRASCSDSDAADRRSRIVSLDSNEPRVDLDGFNVLVTVEAALSGGVLLACRDGVIRDLASMHGSYRKVEETYRAIELIDAVLQFAVVQVVWYLDRPVSNSGRLAAALRDYAERAGRSWEVRLVDDVDGRLKRSEYPVASSDSAVLDAVGAWVDLAGEVVRRLEPSPWIVDLGPG